MEIAEITGVIPTYSTEHSSGMDLVSQQDVIIQPKEWNLIRTGTYIKLQEGYEAQVRSRSGLAYKEGVSVLNSPGTIDSDYRGEIGVILINHSNKPFSVTKGMRIAQLVVAKYERINIGNVVKKTRGEGGFGSTGF